MDVDAIVNFTETVPQSGVKPDRGFFLQGAGLAFFVPYLIGSVSVRHPVHIERATRQHRKRARKILEHSSRSHRNPQAVHIDAGHSFTSTRVNEMGDQPVNIENETAHSKL